jgi:hypothetical protein
MRSSGVGAKAAPAEPSPKTAVADAAERDQQGADGEAVDVQDPQCLVGGG